MVLLFRSRHFFFSLNPLQPPLLKSSNLAVVHATSVVHPVVHHEYTTHSALVQPDKKRVLPGLKVALLSADRQRSRRPGKQCNPRHLYTCVQQDCALSLCPCMPQLCRWLAGWLAGWLAIAQLQLSITTIVLRGPLDSTGRPCACRCLYLGQSAHGDN